MRAIIQEYLNNPHASERLKILSRARDAGEWMPLPLGSDLMKLRLHPDEQIALIKSMAAKQRLAFEDYITSSLHGWDQNVAAAALWEWATRTDGILWHRTLSLASSPLSTQRIRYTLADLAAYGGGFELLQRLVETEGMEEMSVAYHSLICYRALQFGIKSDRLLSLAKQALEQATQLTSVAPEKTLPYYLAYLHRYESQWLKSQKPQYGFSSIWSQFARNLLAETALQKRLDTLAEVSPKSIKKADLAKFAELWPSVWDRHLLEANHLKVIVSALAQYEWPEARSWEFFAGIRQDVLKDVLTQIEDGKSFVHAFNLAGCLLNFADQAQCLERLKTFVQTAENPSVLLALTSPRYSAMLNAGAGTFAKILAEREQAFQSFRSSQPFQSQTLGIWEKESTADDQSRQAFFASAYAGKTQAPQAVKDGDFWTTLLAVWQKPALDKLDKLATEARQAPQLFHLCYIEVLGRYKGIDNAALKLLDYIRSKEEPVLRAVVHALQGIGTVRATQELVAFLTRPNISSLLQLEITQLLRDLDVSHLQAELRSAVNDIHHRTLTDSLHIELHDAISGLLQVEDQAMAKVQASAPATGSAPTTLDLDGMLEAKIARYAELSSEVKRALRTAQFFHLQVEQVKDKLGTIDLSPTIDMQYKALELCFREKFEDAAGEIIRHGPLQRKLDIIGYARPIPQAMDDFELYIENLPIIHTIPFFSRFKLRKMLRAICQYRPGKRFTLDGLKAFSLFFICFSRHECRYGLGNLFPIPAMSTEELFLYCKELHIFQDFRNRAAHEGFHPDASNNLDSIWSITANIFEGMFVIADSLEAASSGKPLRKSS